MLDNYVRALASYWGEHKYSNQVPSLVPKKGGQLWNWIAITLVMALQVIKTWPRASF